MELEVEKNGPPYLFRYRGNNEKTLEELRDNYIFFPNSKKLNDPFDGSHKLAKLNEEKKDLEKSIEFIYDKLPNNKAKEYFKRNMKIDSKFVDFINNGLKQFIDSIGIACFTFHQLNFMLWANYSNNHQGICIQFNRDYDKPFFEGLQLINYVEDLKQVEFNIGNDENLLLKNIFYTKLKIWQEEKELRLTKNKTGKHYFKKEAMRSVIFGLRTSEDFQREVVEVLTTHNPHVKIYKSEILSSGIGLTLTEIL